MKGYIKHNNQYYRRSRKIRKPKEGDLVELRCGRKSNYRKYNGIYTANKYQEIRIENYNGEGITLCLKLGYNVGFGDYYVLVPADKPKRLPKPVKEEKLCGYTI